MSSIIEGYNYDIFISYRQKDNKGDRWVSEFVDSLKTELESTFKEEISVYFDINPHDGLLETHDVDESLMEKLKCLIFIPIISRTYCDPNSFAWEHEFKTFVELASKDQFGLKVKLPNSNVASRVLPVLIHDVDVDDKKLCESIIGGVLRGVEFIYKEPGVNKPLTANDNEKKNLSNTNYKIQVNKTANAIQGIISGLKSDSIESDITLKEDHHVKDKSGEQRKSIIVLPFANMSPNKQDEYFSDGLTEEIITDLAHLKSLRVISRSTSMVLKGTSKDIITIGKELEVNYVLEGSVRKSENKIRITAQLIEASTDEHLWAERFDGTLDDIFDVQERIAKNIADTLKIKLSPEEKKHLTNRPIKDPKAYDLWILAKNEFHRLSEEGINRGLVLIKRAIEIEGDNAQLYATMGYIHWIQYDWGIKHDVEVLDLIQKCAVRALALDPKLPDALIVKGLSLYKRGDLPGCLKFMLLGAMQGGYSTEQFMVSFALAEMGLIDEAHQYVQEAVLISPLDFLPLVYQSLVNMFDGKTDRALSIIRDACDRLAPEEPFVGFWVAHIAALNGDDRLAYSECEKVVSYRSRPFSEFCRLHQLAMDSNHKGVIEYIEKSGIVEIAKTDEYWPICLAIAFILIGEYDEAIQWLKRSVDWGLSNYRFFAEHIRFLEPLRNDNRFQGIIDQARRQHETFVNEVYKPLIQSQKK